jgi:hypothetical protein
MCLSNDQSKTEAFFASRQENLTDSAELSLFLMTWSGVSVEFLLRLFEESLEGHENINEWEEIPKIVSTVQDPVNRKEISKGISLILKRRYKNKMNTGLKLAVKALDSLGKNSKLPENYDKPKALDNPDYKKNLIDMFQRILNDVNDDEPPFKKQGQKGPGKKEKAMEKLGKLLFPDDDDDNY